MRQKEVSQTDKRILGEIRASPDSASSHFALSKLCSCDTGNRVEIDI